MQSLLEMQPIIHEQLLRAQIGTSVKIQVDYPAFRPPSALTLGLASVCR